MVGHHRLELLQIVFRAFDSFARSFVIQPTSMVSSVSSGTVTIFSLLRSPLSMPVHTV